MQLVKVIGRALSAILLAVLFVLIMAYLVVAVSVDRLQEFFRETHKRQRERAWFPVFMAWYLPVMLGAILFAARPASAQARPNHGLTPGAIRTTSEKEICDPDFRTTPFRKTNASTKAKVYAEYDRDKKDGVCCEIDHLVPLELGGLDDISNLWAQPYEPRPGAHEKDLLENRLHALVCKEHKLTLKQAQQVLLDDWYVGYRKYILPAHENGWLDPRKEIPTGIVRSCYGCVIDDSAGERRRLNALEQW